MHAPIGDKYESYLSPNMTHIYLHQVHQVLNYCRESSYLNIQEHYNEENVQDSVIVKIILDPMGGCRI